MTFLRPINEVTMVILILCDLNVAFDDVSDKRILMKRQECSLCSKENALPWINVLPQQRQLARVC